MPPFSPLPPLPPLPVDAALPELWAALAVHNRVILAAPPGSGKTTRVPLALAEAGNGIVLTLEPRRLAARSAARFMAAGLGEPVGATVGYRVRLESNVSAKTRVELITEGILTRRLLSDPELKGVSCVIFDEFHERSLQADLGLALCLEAQQALRPDLRILVMSATLDVEPLRAFLSASGNGCPVIRAEGRVWPVDVRYLPPPAGAGFYRDIVPHAVNAVRRALAEESGSILVFLPGAGEIRRAAEMLGSPHPDMTVKGVTVHPLYGDLPPTAQDAAIRPAPEGTRKIVLSTSLAETSLTIEGVRVVIDAGLSRVSRFDPATGMDALVTERVTQAGADQRAGRAGRLEPGICWRLWAEGEVLRPHIRPEILEADLAAPLLTMLAWGGRPENLPWLTPPPPAALEQARQTLRALGAVSPSGHGLTPHGETLATLPLHPRLGHMLLLAKALAPNGSASYGTPAGHAALAACLAAVVSERDPLRGTAAGADIRPRVSALKERGQERLRKTAEQIYAFACMPEPFRLPGHDLENAAGRLLSLAWPERIAQRRGRAGASGQDFRLASGKGAALPGGDPLADCDFLAVATLHAGDPGKTAGGSGRIFLAAPLTRADIDELHGKRIRQEHSVVWDEREEAVLARSRTVLDALVLDDAPLFPGSPGGKQDEAVIEAVLTGIRSLGLACLPWANDREDNRAGDLRQWQARVMLLRGLDDLEQWPWPDVSDAALLERLKAPAEANWLAPWLGGITRRAQFGRIDLGAALRSLLPYPLAARLEREAPARLPLPSGSSSGASAAVDYTAVGGPVLAVKLQEMFGQTTSPAVASGRVPLAVHLLSPAGRPLQITRDLAGFWKNGYPAVRAEMRGRYPKHPWPDDPLTAVPTGKTKKRMGPPN